MDIIIQLQHTKKILQRMYFGHPKLGETCILEGQTFPTKSGINEISRQILINHQNKGIIYSPQVTYSKFR